MTTTQHCISPLRQRMLDDMRLRKLALKTQDHYIRAVKNFARFLKRSPDTATAQDLRRFQLRLVKQGISSGTLNATITGLNKIVRAINSRCVTIVQASRCTLSPRTVTHVQMTSENTAVVL